MHRACLASVRYARKVWTPISAGQQSVYSAFFRRPARILPPRWWPELAPLLQVMSLLLLPEVAFHHRVALLISLQGEGGSCKPPLRCGKKNPWWCQSQGLSTLANLKLMHLCDQVVISARGVDDKVQLAASTRLRRPSNFFLPGRSPKIALPPQVLTLIWMKR